MSRCQVDKSGKALKSGTFLTVDGVRYPRKRIFSFKNHTSWQKLKSMNHFVFLNFYFSTKNAWHGNSLVVRRVSQGRIILVLLWTKYAVPRQIKPGILKLTTSRGQRNLLTVFIFVSCEEKGCYRIVVSFRWDTKILTVDRTAGSAAVCKVVIYPRKSAPFGHQVPYTLKTCFAVCTVTTAKKRLYTRNS